MHIRYTILLAVLIMISMPILSHAQMMPFGGMVTLTEECDDGLLLTVMGFTGPKMFMWYDGELPYLMYVMPHIGQELLGQASTMVDECWLGDDYVGSGFPIIFHGESM